MIARAAIVVLAAACGSPEPPPAGARLGPALRAALDAADGARLPWRCAAPDGPQLVDETLTVGGAAWKLTGHTLRREGSGAISIGVIADAGGAAAATMAALGRLRVKLGDVDLVLALGGMGTNQAELEATLGALADRAPWPVVALPGDLEAAGDQIAAIAALRVRGLVVVDGRLVRRIELPGVTIATLPGAGSVTRLVAGAEGCGYQPADVTAALADLTPRAGLRILATAEAPRITVRGEAWGERVLVPGAGQQLDLTLHGPVIETATPARKGGREGAAVPLSPGTSDATTRLPGPRTVTSAGVLTVHGTAWRWSPIADVD